jgi:hypothetical protein
VLLAHGEDEPSGLRGLLAHLDDTFQEEGEPALPVSRVSYLLEVLVVRLAVTPEVVGEVEDGLVEDALFDEQER